MVRQNTASIKNAALTDEDILSKSPPWPTFVKNGILTTEQLDLIFTIDNEPVASQVAQFHEKGTVLVELFTAILSGISMEDALAYTLLMLDSILDADAKVSVYFAKFLGESSRDPMTPLLKLVKSDMKRGVSEKAAMVLAKLVGGTLPPGTPPAIETALNLHMSAFAEWVVKSIKEVSPADAAESPKASAAMSGLQALVGGMRGRTAALEADALGPITTLLASSSVGTSSSAVQMLYQTLFALWSLSYSAEAAMEMAQSKMGLIAKLVEIVKISQKEKVIRVALATLRNLLGTGSASNDMVVHNLMPVLESLRTRKFADEDILEDVELLYTTLEGNLIGLTSWDVYKTELESGKLSWSPSHKSDNFWKDNYKAFEANDNAAIKKLVSLLSSDDRTVLAVACNDIAEFVKYHPEGRRLMTKEKAKPAAMLVLNHPDTEVKKYALTCVQRLMVINWDYLNRG